MEIMMDETLEYLNNKVKENSKFTWEIIIVDDGSKDRTAEIALDYMRKCGADSVRLLKLKKNQGKGGAVQQGMLHARGEYMLMVDADGATQISDLDRVLESCENIASDGKAVVVGSRAAMDGAATAQRTAFRKFLGLAFHVLVSTLCVKGIKDTQCGFKLFTRGAAQYLFPNQHLRRWSFDVELLYLAQSYGFPISECGVNWQEIPGSKVDVFDSMIKMARDLVVIRFAYVIGVWRRQEPSVFMNADKKA